MTKILGDGNRLLRRLRGCGEIRFSASTRATLESPLLYSATPDPTGNSLPTAGKQYQSSTQNRSSRSQTMKNGRCNAFGRATDGESAAEDGLSADGAPVDEPPVATPVPFVRFSASDTKTIVDSIPLDRQFVLLGESTHGTEEFYRTRFEVTKRLVVERGFSAVVFEADWPCMEAANEYAHGRRASPYPDGPGRFPAWMWRNQCMDELFDWAKLQPAASTPQLFGMDCYSLFESKNAVVKFLEEHDPAFAAEVSGRLAYLDKFETGFEYAQAMVHGNLSRIAGHITECLTQIQARLQWGSDKYKCTSIERLSAEQNCEVIIAADEYYRKVVSEPRGSQASWNARDQHMATTLLRIQDRLENPKIVVWAHNSHLGDSTASARGGVSFERNETWNLGQMARATFGAANVWIVGQYTYRGRVTAAEDWGRQHADVELKPALPESYEWQLNNLVPVAESPSFSFNTSAHLEAKSPSQCAELSLIEEGLQKLVCGPPRLQRWVGVSYKPLTERQSHYGELLLAQCYDQVVFISVTSALVPVVKGSVGRSPGAQVTRASSQRLLKEYQRLQRKPLPGIEAHPLETNLLEWHFLICCEQGDYASGEYHGSLEFPPEYPMAPPRFKVLTPSGRFEPGTRLCLSMSDYHPESWNPSWSVETLLVGLQSFMYEESNAIGSIQGTPSERRRLAALSKAYNLKNEIYRDLFHSGDRDEILATGEDDKDAASVCRFCFSSEGELLSPCMCKGSQEWLHLECLRQWQKSILLSQPTHPKYQTDIDRICNVCLEPFTGVGMPPSRHEAILQFSGGASMAALVAPGNLLVSTRESSRENLELISQHPEIESRLMPWTKAVFLMLRTEGSHGRGAADGSDPGSLLAVSMSMPVPGPPADCGAGASVRRIWAERGGKSASKKYRLQHYDGGPLQRDTPIAVAHVSKAAQWAMQPDSGVQFVPPSWIYGSFDAVASVVSSDTAETSGRSGAEVGEESAAGITRCTTSMATINVVWGFGGWGGTQILAEIARGG